MKTNQTILMAAIALVMGGMTLKSASVECEQIADRLSADPSNSELRIKLAMYLQCAEMLEAEALAKNDMKL